MATTGCGDRVLVVEVAGLRQQGVVPVSNCTFKVPYGSLARTLQFISRRQGKVIRITSPSASLLVPEVPQTSPTPQVTETPQTSPSSEAEHQEISPSDVAIDYDVAVDGGEPVQHQEAELLPDVEVEEGLPAQPSVTSQSSIVSDFPVSESVSSEPVASETVVSETEEPSPSPDDEPDASASSDPPGLMTRLMEKLRQNIQGPS